MSDTIKPGPKKEKEIAISKWQAVARNEGRNPHFWQLGVDLRDKAHLPQEDIQSVYEQVVMYIPDGKARRSYKSEIKATVKRLFK